MIHDSARTTKFLAAGPSIPYARAHLLPDQVTLQLSDGRHNCETCLPQRAAGVDVFLVAFGNDFIPNSWTDGRLPVLI
jgi:hypothetical protein